MSGDLRGNGEFAFEILLSGMITTLTILSILIATLKTARKDIVRYAKDDPLS